MPTAKRHVKRHVKRQAKKKRAPKRKMTGAGLLGALALGASGLAVHKLAQSVGNLWRRKEE